MIRSSGIFFFLIISSTMLAIFVCKNVYIYIYIDIDILIYSTIQETTFYLSFYSRNVDCANSNLTWSAQDA